MTPDRPTADDGDEGMDPDGWRRRRCILSGEVRSEAGLVRFVAGPDGTLVPDIAADLPGRGCWLRADRESVTEAGRKRAFARGLKQAVSVPDGLADLLESLLAKRFLAGLGMARRAGDLVTGFESVADGLRKGAVALVLEASDGASDGRSKILALAAKIQTAQNQERTGLLALASIDELSAALGVPTVVHAALSPGRHAQRLRRDASRLAGFRPAWPWPGDPPAALSIPPF